MSRRPVSAGKPNGWHPLNPSPSDRPEARLGGLLRKHALPAELRLADTVGAPLPLIESVSWPMCDLKGHGEGRDRSSAIHNLLLAGSDVLHPVREPEVGTIQASKDDTARMESYFVRVSQQAASHARRERICDVHGIASFLDIHLRQPLNVFLDTMLASMESSVSWRPISDGDRTGWELICEDKSDGPSNPLPLAHVHVMWPQRALNQLVVDVSSGALTMREGCRLGYDTSNNPTEEEEVCRLGEYILNRMAASNVDYYVVTDYDNFVLFHHTPPSGLSEWGTIRVLKRLSSEQSLYHMDSPLALLLGITLFALKHNGIEISCRKPDVPPLLRHWMDLTSLRSSPASSDVSSHRSPQLESSSLSPTRMPLDLGPISLTHSWELPDGEVEYPPTTLASTLYGPFAPSGESTLPTLAVQEGLEWYSVTSGHDGYLLMRPGGRRGQGGLWTVNEVILQLSGTDESCTVIEKMSEYYSFKEVFETDWHRTRYTWREAKAAIANEARLYAGPLANLQGTVVPRCLGLFGRLRQDDEIWHMLLEDVGKPLHLEDMVNPVVQAQIRALYQALHAAGVRHGDPRWRHVLRRGNDIRLIDFDRAIARTDGVSEFEWERACGAEKQDVEAMLCNPPLRERLYDQ